MKIEVNEDVAKKFPGIYLGIRISEVKVRESKNLEYFVRKVLEKAPASKEEIKDNPTVRSLRDFYWRLGIDPTKQRPSSEALLRRLMTHKNMPKINNVVDAGNIASAELLVPIGIYDLDKVKGGLVLRFAREGEGFLDITGEKKILKPNEIVLADEEGPIHVFPYRDSFRTKVANDTKRVLIVGCGVPGMSKQLVERACDKVLEILQEI